MEVETVLGALDAPPQSSPASRSPWRGTPRFSGTTSSEPLLPSGSRQEGRLPCFVWKGFPTFRSHLGLRPVSRRHSRRGLVGASTLRSTPISRFGFMVSLILFFVVPTFLASHRMQYFTYLPYIDPIGV